jgi:hypothetical protein
MAGAGGTGAAAASAAEAGTGAAGRAAAGCPAVSTGAGGVPASPTAGSGACFSAEAAGTAGISCGASGSRASRAPSRRAPAPCSSSCGRPSSQAAPSCPARRRSFVEMWSFPVRTCRESGSSTLPLAASCGHGKASPPASRERSLTACPPRSSVAQASSRRGSGAPGLPFTPMSRRRASPRGASRARAWGSRAAASAAEDTASEQSSASGEASTSAAVASSSVP